VIGYGFIGALGHLPAYTQRAHARGDVQIVAIADSCEARRALAAAAHPEARIYADHRTLLAAEAHALDFVDICTPPCDHAPIAHAALDLGLHVLCEKPLTPTLQDAAALLEHAQGARRVLFPCHNYKHAPVVRAIREIIDSGRIGEVQAVALNTMRNTHAKGVTEWHTHWRRHREYSGGGIAMDHGSHSFYLTFDWMGSYPTAVTAKMARAGAMLCDTEDNATITLTFPNGLASAQLSWTAGIRKVTYAIQGSQGAVLVDDDDMQVAVMRTTDGPDVAQGAVAWDMERRSIASHWGDASHTTWFDALFDRFQRAIDTEDWVSKDAREAYRCIEIITAAYQSAADGCREVQLLGAHSFTRTMATRQSEIKVPRASSVGAVRVQ
jgi:predicted dehydrogenase